MKPLSLDQATAILGTAGLQHDLVAAHEYGVLFIRAAQVLREDERKTNRLAFEALRPDLVLDPEPEGPND